MGFFDAPTGDNLSQEDLQKTIRAAKIKQMSANTSEEFQSLQAQIVAAQTQIDKLGKVRAAFGGDAGTGPAKTPYDYTSSGK